MKFDWQLVKSVKFFVWETNVTRAGRKSFVAFCLDRTPKLSFEGEDAALIPHSRWKVSSLEAAEQWLYDHDYSPVCQDEKENKKEPETVSVKPTHENNSPESPTAGILLAFQGLLVSRGYSTVHAYNKAVDSFVFVSEEVKCEVKRRIDLPQSIR